MNSKVRLVVILLVIIAVVILLVRIFGPEDGWICSGGEWSKHGNPTAEMPNQKCLK